MRTCGVNLYAVSVHPGPVHDSIGDRSAVAHQLVPVHCGRAATVLQHVAGTNNRPTLRLFRCVLGMGDAIIVPPPGASAIRGQGVVNGSLDLAVRRRSGCVCCVGVDGCPLSQHACAGLSRAGCGVLHVPLLHIGVADIHGEANHPQQHNHEEGAHDHHLAAFTYRLAGRSTYLLPHASHSEVPPCPCGCWPPPWLSFE